MTEERFQPGSNGDTEERRSAVRRASRSDARRTIGSACEQPAASPGVVRAPIRSSFASACCAGRPPNRLCSSVSPLLPSWNRSSV